MRRACGVGKRHAASGMIVVDARTPDLPMLQVRKAVAPMQRCLEFVRRQGEMPVIRLAH